MGNSSSHITAGAAAADGSSRPGHRRGRSGGGPRPARRRERRPVNDSTPHPCPACATGTVRMMNPHRTVVSYCDEPDLAIGCDLVLPRCDTRGEMPLAGSRTAWWTEMLEDLREPRERAAVEKFVGSGGAVPGGSPIRLVRKRWGCPGATSPTRRGPGPSTRRWRYCWREWCGGRRTVLECLPLLAHGRRFWPPPCESGR